MHQFCFSFFVFYLDFNIIYANIKTITLPPITCYTNGLEDFKVNPQHSYRVVYNGGKIDRSCALLGFYGFADDEDFREYTYQKCIRMEVFDIDCGSTDVSLQYRIRTGQSVIRHLNDTVLQHTYSCNDQASNIPEFCTTNSNDKESLYVNLVADGTSASRIVFNVRSGDKYKLDCKNTFVNTCEDKGEIRYFDLLENGPIPILAAIFGTLFIVAIVSVIVLCRRYRRRKARRERIRNIEREVYGI